MLGMAVAGSSFISLAAIGAIWAYEKVVTCLTPKAAVELPKLALPPEERDEEG